MTRPLCIDLFCGLGGWAEGFLAEGYDVIGFDIEAHDYGTGGYPGQLVIQDVRTLDGKQFKDASVIVASPPCQEYSYMAMPWSKAKALIAYYREDPARQIELNELFNACIRIQREASEAAGHHIPMVVENVRGAIPWVGRSRWHYGSFHLWGDVPALMPMTFRGIKAPGMNSSDQTKRGQDFTRCAAAGGYGGLTHGLSDGPSYDLDHRSGSTPESSTGLKLPGNNARRRWEDREIKRLRDVPTDGQSASVKTVGHANIRNGFSHTRHLTNQTESILARLSESGSDAVKQGGDCFNDPTSVSRRTGSKSNSRKAASAQIAKIPFPLARHIARCFKPY